MQWPPAGAGVCYLIIVLLLSFHSQIVLARVKVHVQGPIPVNALASVVWRRGDNDPTQFTLFKFLVNGDEPTGKPLGNQTIDTQGQNRGNLQMIFNEAGQHIVGAWDTSQTQAQLLDNSNIFDVIQGPTEQTAQTTAGVSSSPSSTALASSTPFETTAIGASSTADPFTSNTPDTTDSASSAVSTEALSGATKTGSNTPIIVGAIIGAIVGLALLLILAFIVLRRRTHQKRSTGFSRDMLVRSDSVHQTVASPATFYAGNPLSDQYYTGMNGPYPTMIQGPAPGPSYENGGYNDRKEEQSYDIEQIPEYSGYGYGTGERKEKDGRSMFSADSDAYDGIQGPSSGGANFVPLTNRQKELQGRIQEWQSKLMGVDKRGREVVLKETERLKRMQESDYARELTDEKPVGYF